MSTWKIILAFIASLVITGVLLWNIPAYAQSCPGGMPSISDMITGGQEMARNDPQKYHGAQFFHYTDPKEVGRFVTLFPGVSYTDEVIAVHPDDDDDTLVNVRVGKDGCVIDGNRFTWEQWKLIDDYVKERNPA